MKIEAADVIEHYHSAELTDRLKAALAAAGMADRKLATTDLAALDQFHSRGLKATVELGKALALNADTKVLDIGSGLGGPSRYLAATYDCRITGIDLSPSFVESADYLASLTGLEDRVSYVCGDATALPFTDDSFDLAYTQHVAMNIADRAKLYGEAYRVVRRGGRFAFYDVLEGNGEALLFPVPWSPTAATSFLLNSEATRRIVEEAGFKVIFWQDKTEEAIVWFEQLKKNMQTPPVLGLNVVMGPDFPVMAANLTRNLQEGKLRLVEAMLAK